MSKRARGTRADAGPKVPINWRSRYRTAPYAGLGKPSPFIPVPPKRGVEFRFQKLLDEAANAAPHSGFQGIEPIVPKEKRPFGCIRSPLYGIRFHGVVSIGALTSIQFEQTNWRLRRLQIPTTPATAPERAAPLTSKNRERDKALPIRRRKPVIVLSFQSWSARRRNLRRVNVGKAKEANDAMTP